MQPDGSLLSPVLDVNKDLFSQGSLRDQNDKFDCSLLSPKATKSMHFQSKTYALNTHYNSPKQSLLDVTSGKSLHSKIVFKHRDSEGLYSSKMMLP